MSTNESRTNVVTVVLDALRFDRVNQQGKHDLTPNITSFIEDAVWFSNAFSTSNVTDVAITSLQTGRYPLSHGIINHGQRVSNQEKTIIEQTTQLQELLAENGYQTAKFGRPLGRWHRKGFDIYPESMEGRVAFDDDHGRRLHTFEKTISATLDKVHPGIRKRLARLYWTTVNPRMGSVESEESDDVVLDRFNDFLGNSAPSYSLIHLMNCHAPYCANVDLVKNNLDTFQYPIHRISDLDQYLGRELQEYFDTTSTSYRRKYCYNGVPTTAVLNAAYDAAVIEVDNRFGQIISTLQNQGYYEESLIVLLADHGESLTDHGIYYDHHGLYDVTTRIPLAIKPPSGKPSTTAQLVQIMDVAPTIASYLDIEMDNVDGCNLQPVIEGHRTLPRDYLIAEEAHTQRRRMVRTENEKLIYLLEGDTICRYCNVQHAPPTEFYQLDIDPDEQHNRNDCSERMNELRAIGEKLARDLASRAPDSKREDIEYEDEEEMYERLEALGYR